jgi:hypothetical protein
VSGVSLIDSNVGQDNSDAVSPFPSPSNRTARGRFKSKKEESPPS